MEINNTIVNRTKPQIQVVKKPECTYQEPVDCYQPSCSGSFESSQMGKKLAKLVYDKSVNELYAPCQREIQAKGFDSIISNSNITQDEKDIAGLGVKFGTHLDDIKDSSVAKARNEVLSALINPCGGSIGQVIAKVTYDAGVKTQYASEQRTVQQDGLEAIVSNSKTSEDEKALAQLGIKFGTHDIDIGDVNVTRARNVILKVLSNPVSDPISIVIQKVIDKIEIGPATADGRTVTKDCLEVVISNPDTSEELKSLARHKIEESDLIQKRWNDLMGVDEEKKQWEATLRMRDQLLATGRWATAGGKDID